MVKIFAPPDGYRRGACAKVGRVSDAVPKNPPSIKGQLLRRVPGYLVLMVVVLVVMHYWRQRPNDLEVVYHLGRKAEGLQSLSATYLRGEEVMGTVRFSYRVVAAKATQRHRIRLPDGDFEVVLSLVYSTRGASSKRTERIRRRILSRGSGEVGVFIAEDS